MQNRLIKFSAIIITLFLYSCANMVPPSGGPKDTTPPKPVKMTPPPYTKNFKEKVITIKFNEYIVLKNISDNLIVSPPSEEKPKVKLNGKQLKIILPDSLLPNTTYILNFGNAIADFTEGNVLHDFKYIFSTGNQIDSLKISGNVADAFSLKPEKSIKVLLYPAGDDSAFYNGLPRYVTTTDKNGNFEFTNLKAGTYTIYALDDKNKNYRYDMPTEKIGFIDNSITPFAQVKTDTSGKTQTIFGPDSIKILTFIEDKNLKNFVAKYKRIMPGKLVIFFNRNSNKKPVIKPITPTDFLSTISPRNDTVTIWITDTNATKKDSLVFAVSYYDRDTLRNDTLYFKWFNKKYKLPQLTLKLKGNTKVPPFTPVTISTGIPVKSADTSKIKLFIQKDTAFVPISYKIKLDNIFILFGKQEEEKYRLIIDSAAIYSIFGNTNDSTAFNFSVQSSDYYGSLKIKTTEKTANNLIIQLTDKSLKKIIKEAILKQTDSIVTFINLPPNEYGLRIISDKSGDGNWTPGDLSKKILPEPVKYEKGIKVKSSWENELEISLPQ